MALSNEGHKGMRLSELSRISGVPVPTIKYYLREQLLPPGRPLTATRAEYGDVHLRRLRLVRALIQVGGVPVATAREVLQAIDDDSLSRTIRLGAALWALPQEPTTPEDDPEVATAQQEIDTLLHDLGWTNSLELGRLSPVYRGLVDTLAAVSRFGYPCTAAELAPYARLMAEVAAHDLDQLEGFPSEVEQVETAVAAAVLTEPLILALRRMAQEEETARRYGL